MADASIGASALGGADLVAGLIGTVAAALGAMFVEWLRADSKMRSHGRTLEELSSCITLLESWSKVYAQVASLPEGIERSTALNYARTIISEADTRLAANIQARTFSAMAQRSESILLRVLGWLRIRAPIVRSAWIPLILYFASAAMAIRIAMVMSVTRPGFIVAAGAAVVFWLICAAMERWMRPAG